MKSLTPASNSIFFFAIIIFLLPLAGLTQNVPPPPDTNKKDITPSANENKAALARLLKKAIGAAKAGDVCAELEALLQAEILDPHNMRIRRSLKKKYGAMERDIDLLVCLEQLSHDNPHNQIWRNNLAWIHATSKTKNIANPGKAIVLAREALLLSPTDPFIWNTLSEAYHNTGRYVMALHAAKRGLELVHLHELTGPPLEEAEQQVKKNKLLVDEVQALSEHNTEGVIDAGYWVKMGQYALQRKRYNEALGAYGIALTYESDNRDALLGEASIYIETKQYQKGLTILEALAAEYPTSYAIKNNIAWIYATADDFSIRNGEKSVTLAREALLLAPNDYHVWSTLSEAYFMSGDYEKAARTAASALQEARIDGAKLDKLRKYYRQLQKCRQAVEAMSLIE